MMRGCGGEEIFFRELNAWSELEDCAMTTAEFCPSNETGKQTTVLRRSRFRRASDWSLMEEVACRCWESR